MAYDTAMLLKQMGLDVAGAARTAAEARMDPDRPRFGLGEGTRLPGQGKPPRPAVVRPEDDVRAFVGTAMQRIWNGRDFAATAAV